VKKSVKKLTNCTRIDRFKKRNKAKEKISSTNALCKKLNRKRKSKQRKYKSRCIKK
jgi:hypothetical protein